MKFANGKKELIFEIEKAPFPACHASNLCCLADGSLLSKDAPASEVSAAHVLGVVCQYNPDRIGEGEKEALGGVAHALVLASRVAGGVGGYMQNRF